MLKFYANFSIYFNVLITVDLHEAKTSSKDPYSSFEWLYFYRRGVQIFAGCSTIIEFVCAK